MESTQQSLPRFGNSGTGEERLRKCRLRDKARRAVETEDQRAARLARLRANQNEMLATETEEQRVASLARLSANRLAVETEEQRGQTKLSAN